MGSLVHLADNPLNVMALMVPELDWLAEAKELANVELTSRWHLVDSELPPHALPLGLDWRDTGISNTLPIRLSRAHG